MPFYDLICEQGHEQIDVLLPHGEKPPCPTCGGATSTLWNKFGTVVPDEIPGGIWIRHGLTDPDGNPQKFYSKSEIHAEAKRRGMLNLVEHVPIPGTDKSPVTTRWTGAPSGGLTPEAEAERVANHWSKRAENG